MNTEEVLQIIQGNGGQIRMSDALVAGISRCKFYAMRDQGILTEIARGVYRISDLAPVSEPDLLPIALRVPHAVICLISALSFHDITTQIPHNVDIAIEVGSRPPKIDYPPVSIHKFSKQSYRSGIEEHLIDGAQVKIYSPEKTLADCFKFRNKIGVNVAIEALKFYRERKKLNVNELIKQSRICRVEKVMRPYLEIVV
ncbi:MAG: type IV toxin-antitoxin system AbiEi family antitoxin domain-containing protein [Lentisphaeria bacterium]|nr:type IV toxin-antitoxin system AbiEi family antitoxin domain-containing protein [Lentisphaeria bacterium]NQZ67248.1 type IV toxin-antitoxin system AbiEi family antitoxin domain-containing protein [Lentisphaeria bacterium]